MTIPAAALLTKLAAAQSVTVQVIGDSTAWGAWDTGWNQYTNPWTYPTLYGWPGRFCIALGEQFNATVVVHGWNYYVNTGYESPVTLHTGSSGATLTLYLGGWPGGTLANYIANAAAMLPVPNPDLVIIHDGFNESGTAAFAANYLTFINAVQHTYCPGAPIVVTTQSATTATRVGGNPTFASLFAAMISAFLPGKTLPLSPVLQASTAVNGVWVLDTQRAFAAVVANGTLAQYLYSDGLHPVAAGYALLAIFIHLHLVSENVVLPADWVPQAEFAAQDENTVGFALNGLRAALIAFGATPPQLLRTDWQTGAVWTADDQNNLEITINAYIAAVASVQGNSIGLPTQLAAAWETGVRYPAAAENTVEAAVNMLRAAVETLQG